MIVYAGEDISIVKSTVEIMRLVGAKMVTTRTILIWKLAEGSGLRTEMFTKLNKTQNAIFLGMYVNKNIPKAQNLNKVVHAMARIFSVAQNSCSVLQLHKCISTSIKIHKFNSFRLIQLLYSGNIYKS